jgi:excisionase family DNA binding protein
VSTTTAADLINRADLLVRVLRNRTDPVSLAESESFDVTAYRLLHQMVGTARASDDLTAVLAHAALVRVLQSYPAPLRPPVGATTYSTQQAAQFLGMPRDGVLHRIHRGDIPATTDGRSYRVAATDLDQRTDLVATDSSDPRPLPRLSCTFGLLADLLVADRDREVGILPDESQVAALMAHVLTLTAVAARHTMGHCPVTDADRPLRVAQFAERAGRPPRHPQPSPRTGPHHQHRTP